MSDDMAHPSQQDDLFAPDEPFAPDAIDDTIAVYQSLGTPPNDSNRLIMALVAVHQLPPDAQDVLERVRQRVLHAAEASELQSVSVGPNSREKEMPATRTSSRQIPATQTSSRFGRGFSFATLAAVLIVTLLLGSYFALVTTLGRQARKGNPVPMTPTSTLPTSWSLVSSPNRGTDSILWTLAAVSASDVWAVGSVNLLPNLSQTRTPDSVQIHIQHNGRLPAWHS